MRRHRFDEAKITGWGSVILAQVSEVRQSEALEFFRLHSGMVVGEEIPLHRRHVGDLHYFIFCIDREGRLLYRAITVENDVVVHREHLLETPEDFLCVGRDVVEELYERLIQEDYWENLSYTLAHRGKPGYPSGENWYTSLSQMS